MISPSGANDGEELVVVLTDVVLPCGTECTNLGGNLGVDKLGVVTLGALPPFLLGVIALPPDDDDEAGLDGGTNLSKSIMTEVNDEMLFLSNCLGCNCMICKIVVGSSDRTL